MVHCEKCTQVCEAMGWSGSQVQRGWGLWRAGCRGGESSCYAIWRHIAETSVTVLPLLRVPVACGSDEDS